MISTIRIVLALAACLPTLVIAAAQAESYAACLDAAPAAGIMNQVTSAAAGDDCSAYCFDRNFRYSIITPGGLECGCSNTGPTAAEFSSATDSQMSCTAAQYDVRIARTTFSVPLCYTQFSTATNTGRTGPVTVSDVNACFKKCLSKSGATVIPDTDGLSYQCYCDDNGDDVDEADRTPCQQGVLVRYKDHVPFETTNYASAPGASNFVKRAQREQLRLKSQKEKKLCPLDGTACLVGRGSESWECVGVQTELESCGGCIWGEYGAPNGSKSAGIDCSALPGVTMGGVTCTHGQCAIWACDPGFKLQGRECVPISHAWGKGL